MKTPVPLLVTALLVPLLGTAGCHHKVGTAARIAPAPGITVWQARLVLSAVTGHPAAAYFTLGNGSHTPDTLVGVTIAGVQSSEMHQTSGDTMTTLTQVEIDPGQRVSFAPGGKHVMAFGVAPTLTPGGTSVILFHFRNGKTTSAPLRVEAPGDGSDDMAGMKMGSKP